MSNSAIVLQHIRPHRQRCTDSFETPSPDLHLYELETVCLGVHMTGLFSISQRRADIMYAPLCWEWPSNDRTRRFRVHHLSHMELDADGLTLQEGPPHCTGGRARGSKEPALRNGGRRRPCIRPGDVPPLACRHHRPAGGPQPGRDPH